MQYKRATAREKLWISKSRFTSSKLLPVSLISTPKENSPPEGLVWAGRQSREKWGIENWGGENCPLQGEHWPH